MIRPSLESTIELMQKLAVEENPEPDMLDLLDVAEWVNFDHQSIDDYSEKHGWGVCETCETLWPCGTWVGLEYALAEWLIKAVNKCMSTLSRSGT